MSTHHLQHALLRPPVLHILRAAGFHSTRPAVLDSLTELAGRYMEILARAVAAQCALHGRVDDPQLQDVREAMEEAFARLLTRFTDGFECHKARTGPRS